MNPHGNANSFNAKNKKGQTPITMYQSNQNKLRSNTMNNSIKPLSQSSRITRAHNKDIAQLEEEIHITVPTPYPKAQFMTVDDPNLQSSEYTTALNQKYPPRQYLKHNQQSWNKIVKPKSSDIKFTFMNPKISFSDYNLKSITYKNEEIGKVKLTNLDEAEELVDKLKTKLIEYELTNNSNIQQANEMVANYKQLIETYKAQLNDLENKLDYIEHKYDIDIDHLNEDDPYTIITKGFRRRWLIKNFMNGFVTRITRQKIIKHQYYKNIMKKNVLLKLKSFISLEKSSTTNTFAKALRTNHLMKTIKTIFYSLRFNRYINRLHKQFGLVQRNMSQLLYLKELKLRIYKKKNYQSKNYKALMFYYRNGVSKAIWALNKNCIRNSHKKLQTNKVNYAKFASSLGKIDKTDKENKIKGMNRMKGLIAQITEVNKKKISNANNDTAILIHYIREWKKGALENKKVFNYNILIKQHMIQFFFKSTLQYHKLHNYSLVLNNSKVLKSNAKLFFTTIKRNMIFKSKCIEINYKIPMIIKSTFIKRLQCLLIDNPKLRFRRITKQIVYGDFINSLRNNVKYGKAINNIIQSYRIFNARSPIIYSKIFFSFTKKTILLLNHKAKRIKGFVSKYLISKSLHFLLIKAYKCKQIGLRNYYETTIANIKTIITEKSGMINKLEYDNKDLAIHFDQNQAKIQTSASENKLLRQSLYDQQYHYENELRRYRELIEQNANDVRSLQKTIKNNETMLSEAISREEQLQNKYANDIQNVVKLNKNLNDIITKKNQQLLDANLIKQKEAEEEQFEKQKKSKQNADLYNNMTYTIKQKEYEKKQLEEDKNKQIHQSSVLLEHYQKEKQMVDYKNTQLMKENQMLLTKMHSQGY